MYCTYWKMYWIILWAKPTLDLWLNLDSSICTTTPGPPSLGMGCNNSVCHAISRHRRANLIKAFLRAIPCLSITNKGSFWHHFQRKWVCRWSDILLLAKKDPSLTDFWSLQRLHFLKPNKKVDKVDNFWQWLQLSLFKFPNVQVNP